jgi:hypothetical protein
MLTDAEVLLLLLLLVLVLSLALSPLLALVLMLLLPLLLLAVDVSLVVAAVQLPSQEPAHSQQDAGFVCSVPALVMAVLTWVVVAAKKGEGGVARWLEEKEVEGCASCVRVWVGDMR